jgi:S1-C subfamily serine protease
MRWTSLTEDRRKLQKFSAACFASVCGTFICRKVLTLSVQERVGLIMVEYRERSSRSSTSVMALVLVAGLLIGGLVTSFIFYMEIDGLNKEISGLKSQVSNLWGQQNYTVQNITLYQNGTALRQLYDSVKDSIVLVHGTVSNGSVQGSGFVYNFTNTMVVITNNHVVHGTTSVSVTFSNGNGYAANVTGTDPYADLAVLTVDAPASEFLPLEIVGSSMLRVGDPVVAIGNPYGLVGSLTTGVVSALGRTISEEEYIGAYSIANIIQTSTPINPGNSGGPLLNFDGNVIGITTAIVADSQGLGFAVPSNTILKEIYGLVVNRGYEAHSYLGVSGSDMDYERAQDLRVNVTYGWWIASVVSGGPAATAGLRSNDVIVGINGTRMRNGDEMLSFLEEYTLPNQNVTLRIVRGTQVLDIQVHLGQRPPP